jgi:hypothetical protein
MLTRVFYGARLTLGVAGAAVVLSLVIGLAFGPLAAMRGGWTDLTVSRSTDVLISFPPLLVGLFFLTIMSPSPQSVALAVGIAGAPAMVRQIRAAFLAERAKDYVLAAQALGAGRWRIAVRQILPNCTGIILLDSHKFSACSERRLTAVRERWTPFFGPRKGEIKLAFQALLGLGCLFRCFAFTLTTPPRLRRPARSEPLRPARVEAANGGRDAAGASAPHRHRHAAGLAPYDSGE